MLPQTYLDFQGKFSEIIERYNDLGEKIQYFGSLDVKSRRLVARKHYLDTDQKIFINWWERNKLFIKNIFIWVISIS